MGILSRRNALRALDSDPEAAPEPEEDSGGSFYFAGKADDTAAFGMAAGLVSRIFATAKVRGTDKFSPVLLAQYGYRMVTEANCVIYLDRELRLNEASNWDLLRGDAHPSTWRYMIDTSGPTRGLSLDLPAASVIHTRLYARSGEQERGKSPVDNARVTRDLASGIESQLSNEASRSSGYIASWRMLREKGMDRIVAALTGRTRFVEMKGDRGSPHENITLARVGINPPTGLVSLRKDVLNGIVGLMGVPAGLRDEAGSSAYVNAMRLLQETLIEPLAALLAYEATRVLETEVSFSFPLQMRSDRFMAARLFKTLRDAGMSPEAAFSAALLDEPNE